MDYTLIISFLAFFGAVQMCVKIGTGPLVNALVAVGIPFVADLALKWIYVAGYGLLLFENLFSFRMVVTVIVQFIAALFIFRKLGSEDNTEAWIGWGVGGALVIIILLPYVVSRIITY